MKVIKEQRKLDDIKKLINQTSKKYKNFKGYNITPHDILTDTYNIFLYFDDIDECENNMIYVEVIKNILNDEIESFIKQSYEDFENLDSIDILQNTDKNKRHLSHVILRFKVSRDTLEFIPVDIIERLWSGGSKLGGCEVCLEISKYKEGQPYSSYKYSIDQDIYITQIYKGMLIRIQNNPSYYNMFFKITQKENEEKYTIIEYGEKYIDIWDEERPIIREWEFNSLNIDELINELINKLTNELNIYVSKRSIKVIKHRLIYMAEVSKLNYC